MVYIRNLSLCLILMLPQFVFGNGQLDVSQNVLDRLYQVHGHFNTSRPKIELVKNKKNVAVYIKSRNTIQLELSAYNLCIAFGRDSLDALSFILAHELVHALQTSNNLPKTSFIAYDKTFKGSVDMERDADIQGIFISYLAGYKSIKILPDLIDRMYEVYGINDKIIRAYPSKHERKLSAQVVIQQVNDLIELFELANRLTQISAYQSAIPCLEYISKYYQGKEIFNNLGVNYVLLGMNMGKLQGEALVFPFELDWNLRIKKPKTGRGDDFLSPIDLLIQQKYYLKAQEYFEVTKRLDPTYFWSDLNLFAINILRGKLDLAQGYYDSYLKAHCLVNHESVIFQKINFVYAILLFKKGEIEEAKRILKLISSQNNPYLSHMAKYNLKVITNGQFEYAYQNAGVCNTPGFKLVDIPDTEVKLTKTSTMEWIVIDTAIQIERRILSNSMIYTFFENNEKSITIQKINISNKYNFNIDPILSSYLGKDESVYHCAKDGIAYLVRDGLLNGIIRYYTYYDNMP
ncbi:MAG: hypothetical protein IPH98_08950 [Saprospiraceae bacterium]|nr:hypothetical protein [Candidatus Defluviibacterium haderslevense]